MTADTDEQLVERMTRGDRHALGELYKRHAPRLRLVIAHVVGDPAASADLLQDVFLEAWRKCEQFDASRGSARAWLTVRARSRALDRMRSASYRHEDSAGSRHDNAAPETQTEQETAEPSLDAIYLPTALQHVSEEEREILRLGYFEDLTCAEIAERLDIPIGTVKSRTRRALEKLRTFWKVSPQ